jgi:hypothetical protein
VSTHDDDIPTAHVVEIVETWNGAPGRTFFAIYDPDFGHWMSTEPFDGLIWTKDYRCRRQFESRKEATLELTEFLAWQEQQDAGDDLTDEIPWDREAV